MDPLISQLTSAGPLLAVVAALFAATVIGVVFWWVRRRRAARSIPNRLRRASEELLAGVLIPNAETGQIHLEYALLTRRGVMIVDVRDVAGHVFGSDTMQDWTVLARNRRYTFPNPLPALYDRIAAVRRLLPDMPVRGYVAFTGRADFSKGYPPNVILLDRLIEELAEARSAADGPPPEILKSSWAGFREEAVASQVRRFLES